jgi:hypothetical protein
VIHVNTVSKTLIDAGSGNDGCTAVRNFGQGRPPLIRAESRAKRRDVDWILRCCAEHYNEKRPHRGLGLRTPLGEASERPISLDASRVRRIDVLDGLIHEYEPVAA